jgi:DNA polymerase II small subunit
LSEHIRRFIQDLALAGYQLDRSAFDYLRTMEEPEAVTVAKTVLVTIEGKAKLSPILTKKELVDMAAHALTVQTSVPVATPIASKQIMPQVQVVRDPSKELGTGGGIEDFSHYFRDRFQRLVTAFRARQDARDAATIATAMKASQNQRVKFLAMVVEKRERQGRIFLQLDDLEDGITVLASSEEKAVFAVAQKVPLDQVVCVEGVRAKGDLVVAKQILLPDIPDHKPRLADEAVWTVLLSDLHVGSKKFLSEQLNRVLDWLNMKVGDKDQRAIAERVKYVVICGDIVDGIGVYPRQEQELAIVDLYEQYREAAKYVRRIPDHIETIILPGNHDAVRQALPQPPIPKDFGEPLYEARSLISIGNPSEITLHGVRLLLHHGRSLDDIIASVPNMDFTQPEKAMRLQLQCRHLASEYGKRTAIAPERTDHLVIDNVPDIFQSGHIHVMKYENYRGTQIVNSGAWQSQTDYQRRGGVVPTPGILTVVNLQNLQVRPIDFMH